ncbi:barwin-like endoglucanase [Violaceomyces palustris]|uniref:Barwin-like endoglucanase n=1 Tax=Violaceomyces palustris TaxID=1673888 RepID=A0ACD0NLG0_9BASI|nr:barwin-like endoglucanase [Violaceomyces palustris]
MFSQRFFLLALAATLATLLVASSAVSADPTPVHISQNAMARNHRARMLARQQPRSVDLGSQRIVRRKATAAQREAQQELNNIAQQFAAKNSEWQQAAIEQLKQGKTPQTYDQYWANKEGTPTSDQASSDEQDQPSASTTTHSSEDAQASPTQQAALYDTKGKGKGNGKGDGKGDGNNDQESESESSTKTTKTRPATSTPSSITSTVGSVVGSLTSGQATYFAPGLGACGWTNSASDYIVAVSHSLFDSFGTGNPNNNPICGHKIRATYQGKSVEVEVTDRCEGCAWGDLDFTETAFKNLAPLSLGRLDGMTWQWVGSSP